MRITLKLDPKRLLPRQRDFVFAKERFVAYVGGIGSGKTFAGAVKALLEAVRYPGTTGLILAPTYPMVRDVVLETVYKVTPRTLIKRYLETKHTMYLVNGSKILFRSADKPDKLRGLNLAWAWLDEAAYMERRIWDVVIGRLRDKRGSRRAWLTTTPRGKNWIWEIFVKDKSDSYAVIHATTYDNVYLPTDYIRALEEKYTGEFREQELLGRFVTFEGLVYKEFDELKHVIDVLPERSRLKTVVAGVDWGYTNPAVILVVGIDGDGRYYVLEEFYERNKLVGDIVQTAKELKEKWNIEIFYCDPSEPAFIAEFRKAGLVAVGANNDVMAGIAQVKALLTQNRLFLHRSCRNTIEEMGMYRWEERKGTMLDTPRKEHDHAMDALRYAIASHIGSMGVVSIKIL
jgi:PBSX family phage terminase large subunit